MGVRVLGPLELECHHSVTTPSAHKERVLLAITALELGRRIPAHALVDAIWGDGPPRTATTTLRSYISRLRRILTESPCGLELVGGPDSYGLEGSRGLVDAVAASDDLHAATDAMEGGRPHEASQIAQRALSFWRGEPLADFATEDWARPYRARLMELELSLKELHFEAALATGADMQLLPELESLLHRHPLRERLCGLRMLALYRAGRQSDALRAYHDIGERLREEQGLDPGPELRRLERAILTHSPELLVAPNITAAARPAATVSGQAPVIRYTSKSGVHIAYRIDGSGTSDLLVMAGGLIPVDSLGEEPYLDAALRRLGRSARIIHFDRRGLGMSDPVGPGSPPTLEQWMEDALSVLDASGSDRVDVLAWADGALLGVLVAAAHPERVRSLTIVNGFARFREGDDQPWGLPREEALRVLDDVVDPAAEAGRFDVLSVIAPSVARDLPFRAWWDRAGHRAASPATARALRTLIVDADVRRVLGSVGVPTCVIHRTENAATPVDHGRFLAERIPDARLLELPGADDLWWVGDSDPIIDEIERMLVGAPLPPEVDRVLVTVLITDIVGSTERATAAGDRSWRLQLDQHEAVVREELDRFGGREIKTTGDGFLATFDAPARAVRAAIAIRDRTAALGLGVRAGLHTGEVEVRHGDIHGIAVHLAARVSAAADGGEIIVSRTVVDLVAGSGLRFEDRGTHRLKGMPDPWQLYAAC